MAARWVMVLGTMFLCAWLTGCATGKAGLSVAQRDRNPGLTALQAEKPVHQLRSRHFFAQRDGHCGPSALAMVLSDLGYAVSPEQASPLTFLPARQGSLQLEMMAAARRLGALAVRTSARLDALLQSVADNHSPIVLLNLGLSWSPRWHYTTITGYDLDAGTLTLRSGTDRAQTMSLYTFSHVWGRAKRWAFTLHRPGSVPSNADEAELIDAALAFERMHPGARSLVVWRAVAARWPNNKVAHIGLGNQAYAMRDLAVARSAFERAATIDGRSIAAWNNLAVVLTDLGLFRQAQHALTHAARTQAVKGPAATHMSVTRAELKRARLRASYQQI